MAEEQTIVDTLRNNRPASWDHFPDLELYMDQLLSYVNRQQPFTSEEPALTKSMVNNYIKQEIIVRPNGKRYNQEHIAQLTMLSLLKEVLPIQDCQELFREVGLYEDTEATYNTFLQNLDDAMNSTAATLAETSERNHGADALRFALYSYASRRVAMALLEEAKLQHEPEPETNSNNKKAK